MTYIRPMTQDEKGRAMERDKINSPQGAQRQDDWWSTAGGVQSALREEIKRRDDRIEDLEAERDALAEKLEKVAGALREYLSPTAEPEDDGIPLLRATLAQITEQRSCDALRAKGDKTDA